MDQPGLSPIFRMSIITWAINRITSQYACLLQENHDLISCNIKLKNW